MKSSSIRRVAALLLACLVLAPAVSRAQATVTAQDCLKVQLNASGVACAGLAKCYAKAMKTGLPLSTACVDMKQNDLVAATIAIEAVGNCLVKGEGRSVGDMLGMGADDLGNSLTLAGGRCAGMKMGALGKACAGFLRCNAMADASSSPLDPACIAARANRLTALFTRIESHGKCKTTGDLTTLETKVAHLVDSVHVVFRGTGTTTTSSTATTN